MTDNPQTDTPLTDRNSFKAGDTGAKTVCVLASDYADLERRLRAASDAHYIPQPKDMNEPKYAAIKTRSIHHEGDERSRTHPGHGYPAHTETFAEIQRFKDRAEMQRFVEREAKSHYPEKFTVIEYRELEVSTTVNVNVKP